MKPSTLHRNQIKAFDQGMTANQFKMVITDLDGTLLNPQHQISDNDLKSLKLLGENKICRVVATGRTLYSARKVLTPDFPIEYLIFSTGAGIINWKSQDIIHTQSLSPAEVTSIANFLFKMKINFSLHKPIPDNHHFTFYQTKNENSDFKRRLKLYEKFARPLNFDIEEFGSACQFLIIIPEDISIYEKLRTALPQFNVVRTTSPLDGKSMWIEIFPLTVSKGLAAAWLCERLGCSRDAVIGIGNDYNDLDLLKWTRHSYIMANAPEDLKQKFEVTGSNVNSGFTQMIQKMFNGYF